MKHLPTDLDYLRMWPCVVVIEDCYVPELAAQALEIADTVSMEDLGAQCVAEAAYAETRLTRN